MLMKEYGGVVFSLLLFHLDMHPYPKNLHFCVLTQKQEKFHKTILNLNNNGVRYRLAYPENASFLYVPDLLRSHTT
jgi:hypothetical protein